MENSVVGWESAWAGGRVIVFVDGILLRQATAMGHEYKIQCVPLKGEALSALLQRLPSPILRPQMREIYNYKVEEDGYYLVDHLLERSTAAVALQLFVDAALSTGETVTIIEPGG